MGRVWMQGCKLSSEVKARWIHGTQGRGSWGAFGIICQNCSPKWAYHGVGTFMIGCIFMHESPVIHKCSVESLISPCRDSFIIANWRYEGHGRSRSSSRTWGPYSGLLQSSSWWRTMLTRIRHFDAIGIEGNTQESHRDTYFSDPDLFSGSVDPIYLNFSISFYMMISVVCWNSSQWELQMHDSDLNCAELREFTLISIYERAFYNCIYFFSFYDMKLAWEIFNSS